MNHAVDWARTLGGLFVVLAMIVAAGWLLRRLQHRAGMGPGRRSQVISVVAQQMLGAREKVVVVEVEDTWLVLGVTQQHVQTLHTLPRPADAAAANTPQTHAGNNTTPGSKPPAFADALASELKRRFTGNTGKSE
ncbi:flagellar biosynthetic protein FliO [Ralstonia sp. 24A2]|uniref:flagellar biosynthetic protein FliO n=1 Tax=Ralstonia sp. 24A2 TaxID=3447364 RepID=UPI003F69BFFB